MSDQETLKLPRPFVMRRLHSLLGLWLVIYLFEHLLVNSQAALFFHDDGSSFVRLVNKIHAMPFLKVIEIMLLGVPFLVHAIWGIQYVLKSKLNSFTSNGASPSLPYYRRNRAFTWQRLTSWILLVGILAHVVQMRFIYYPTKTYEGEKRYYFVRLKEDPQLFLVAAKLQSSTFTKQQLTQRYQSIEQLRNHIKEVPKETNSEYYAMINQYQEQLQWYQTAQKKPLKLGQVLVVTPNAGAAFFLVVRETFKSALMVMLYTIFVIAAAYHAFNGLWTFVITWGITLTRRAQNRMRLLTTCLMSLVILLGLMAIWGPYWTFQFQG